MVFGQLTAKDSMRDLMLSLEAHRANYYHLGFGSRVSRRNLGTANERRNYEIFEEFAYVLLEEACEIRCHHDFEHIFTGQNIYKIGTYEVRLQ